MKDKLRKNLLLLILRFLLICAVGVILEAQSKILRRAYDDFVLDNRDHYLPCKDLPAKIEVEKVVEGHADVIQQIQQIAPGVVGLEIDSSACEGKADLLFWYGTHDQRIAIENIIGDETFFGVPYRLQNR